MSVAVQIYLRLRIVERREDAPDAIAWEFVGGGPSGENRIESAYRLARARVGRPAPGLRVQVRERHPADRGARQQRRRGGGRPAPLRAGERHGRCQWRSRRTLAGAGVRAGRASRQRRRGAARRPDRQLSVRRRARDRAIVASGRTPCAWSSRRRMLGLHTSEARRVLPQDVPLRDAIFNLQRALLLRPRARVRALRGSARGDARPLAPAGPGAARPRPGRGAGAGTTRPCSASA